MKIAATILAIAAVVFVVLRFGNGSVSDRLQTRRYEISSVLLSGGKNTQQQRLHRFCRAALDAGGDNLMRRTFEETGIDFPEGTTAILNPADTHLYIRHHISVLDVIERDFSIQGSPYRPPSRVRLFIEDTLVRIGIGISDPFAQTTNNTARTSRGTPLRFRSDSKRHFWFRNLTYHFISVPRIELGAL